MTKPTSLPSPEEQKDTQPEAQIAPKRRKRPLWVRILKWTGITGVTVVALVALLISLVVWTLTPERLTPLVNKYASEYLIADVNARRIELTFWSTFPDFSVKVDTLEIRSRALDSIPDSVKATLPADADSLLYLRHFEGGINLAPLFAGNISLYDVDFTDLRANLVQVDSLTANYLITPPSEEVKEEKPLVLPDIAINRFSIIEGLDVRFRMPSQNLDARVRMTQCALTDQKQEKPLYKLDVNGDAALAMPWLKVPTTPFMADGNIEWESKHPLNIALRDFTIGVGDVKASFETVTDMTGDLKIHELTATLPEVPVVNIIKIIPEEHRAMLKQLRTDMTMAATVRLLKPFVPSRELPIVDLDLKAKARSLTYERLSLSRLITDISGRFDLSNPDASTINIRNLGATGKAIDFTLKGTVSRPVSDPRIDGSFDGSVTIQNLPSELLATLGMALRGTLTGHAEVKTRLSYLTPKEFHRAKINGNLALRDFRMAMDDGSLESYIRHAELAFGSSADIKVTDHVIDSMLTLSAKIDTAAMISSGVKLTGSALSAGIGARNIAGSADTSRINPIGARITAGRLRLRSEQDSAEIRVREAQITASLQRYEGQSRAPLMKASLTTGRVRYIDRYNRLSMRTSEAHFTMHPRHRPEMPARARAVFDSLAAAHPELTTDSIRGMMRAGFRNRLAEYDKTRAGREDLKFDLDYSIYGLIRRWDMQGDIKSERARLFTPYFPSRNVLRNLNLSFSTDSVSLHNTTLEMNHSDFLLNGSLTNIARALMSRHGSPFKLDFSVSSDTVDINDLTATMIRGAVFTERIRAGAMKGISDSESDEAVEKSFAEATPDTMRAAVLVPSNISGKFSLKAKHVLYTDLWLNNLDGLVEIYDGAINLDRLRAFTAIGAVNFSALYSAPTLEDISLAAAMRVRKLNLRSVLDMMPEIDSILPLLGEVRGIVDADLALTSRLDSMMNIDIPSLSLALKISGDSLQLLDNETFRTIAKWMMFKKKKRNLIDHMDVELAIHNGYIDLYPFIFDMDRYRLGVRGSNDANFNLNYHVSVIKSPIPFKFGINIKGTPEKMKIRLGKARINEKTVAETRHITDTVRVNLINEMGKLFRRGMKAAGSRGLKLQDNRKVGSGATSATSDADDKFTHADSVNLIQQGLIARPKGFIMPGDTITTAPQPADTKNKKKKKK